jgi:hypothetical protein
MRNSPNNKISLVFSGAQKILIYPHFVKLIFIQQNILDVKGKIL